MNEELRAAIWRRDNSTCQVCRKKLTATVTINPQKNSADESLSIEEIPVFKWHRTCWRCGKKTPVVSYDLIYDVSYNIGDVQKLDNLLMESYPFVKRTYSKAQGKEVVANTCVHCGIIQGNSSIIDELADMMAEAQDTGNHVDLTICTTLTSRDLNCEKPTIEKPYQAEVTVAQGEIHHKDGNWQNNDPQNLVLLCKNCHSKIRPVPGSGRTRKESRDERRGEMRIRRERLEADRWRENYYASKKQRANKTDLSS